MADGNGSVRDARGRFPPNPTKPASGVLARSYSWQSAGAGNELALRHGAFSPKFVDPQAKELVDRVLELAAEPDSGIAYLLQPKYARALMGWARAEIMADRLNEAVVRENALAPGGAGSPRLNQLDRYMTRAETLRARLGLDPLSWAKLRQLLAAGTQADQAAQALETHRELMRLYGRGEESA